MTSVRASMAVACAVACAVATTAAADVTVFLRGEAQPVVAASAFGDAHGLEVRTGAGANEQRSVLLVLQVDGARVKVVVDTGGGVERVARQQTGGPRWGDHNFRKSNVHSLLLVLRQLTIPAVVII